jgi:hypothetical protein
LMVITQETTQPLATLHRLLTTRLRDPTEQQDVGLPLMIPLGMVMLDVFAQRPPLYFEGRPCLSFVSIGASKNECY